MFKQRKYFFGSRSNLDLPDLTEIQKSSYSWFLKNGIKELIKEFSPIEDSVGKNFELHFLGCSLGSPKFDEIISKNRNLTYEAPLTVKVRLINKKTGKKINQEIYFSDIPLMTERGTFIINGIERVVVQQLIRSPGAFFSAESIKGRLFYGAKIIPDRGAWLEFETDTKGVIWVRIDRQRKTPATALLRVFGYGTDKEILDLFTPRGSSIEKKKKYSKLDVSALDYIKATLEKDPSASEEEGLIEVYRKIRPGDLATVDNAKSLIYAMFFSPNRYDLSKVGRYKINQRLGFKNEINNRVLRPEDFVAIISEVIRLNLSQGLPDDIDHLANRRIRAVGELVQNRMRVGMLRIQRIVKDRMSVAEDKTTPGQLINIRPITGVIKEFFMSSQLSQFMDQTNILSELSHKRRLTVAGPGGLSRERAGFEVRDVHRTYYGKICPIATPEGPNVGLVSHLSCYARLNQYGFIETPYQKIVNGKLINKVVYLNAYEEEQCILAPFSVNVDKSGRLADKKIEARIHGRPSFCKAVEVEFIDVAANQIVSVATSLIPFLEHDDGVRALMGTNMQRQAVPLINPESPIIGTGIEGKIARDSGHLVIAQEAGQVSEVDASHVRLITRSGKSKIYYFNKYLRSNFDTCFNQRPSVVKNQRVKVGDILACGSSIENGELALGQNLLCAFMVWEGGNYEDAILISSRLVEKDRFTSLHIDEHTVDIRETKFGPETTTRDIPNVSEEKLRDLDEEGIIRIGAEVKSGDILVGKITPKGEAELTAEEKLLRAIFGEKAQDVRDSSLYLEHGEHGKVIGVKIFSREKGDKLSPGVVKSIRVLVADLRKIQVGDKMAGRHGNKGVVSRIVSQEDMPYLADGTPIDIILNPLGVVSRMNLGQVLETHLGLAAEKLGYIAASPSLNGVSEEIIKQELIKAGFDTLVESGYQPEIAYFEVLHELKLITDLIQETGISGMRRRVSNTACYGDLTRGKRIITERTRKEMKKILKEVQKGKFAREWIKENEAGRPNFNSLLKENDEHQIEQVGRQLREMMPWMKH